MLPAEAIRRELIGRSDTSEGRSRRCRQTSAVSVSAGSPAGPRQAALAARGTGGLLLSLPQEDTDLPSTPDATAVATVLIADGLKDLSDILDPLSRARHGFERRLQA